jgi:broad specificity phosphatase PhoE
VAAGFKGKGIEYVITSPFVRCLQTSAEIVEELGLEQGRWLVIWPMCEVRLP